MATGLAVVVVYREPWTLSVAATVGWFVTSALLAKAVGATRAIPNTPERLAFADIHYSVKSAGLSLVRQLSSTIAPWSVGRFAGAAELGAFNRATTLITLPIDTVQRSLAYALFPELRPGSKAGSHSRIITDMVTVIAWASIVVVGIGYFLAAPLAILVLGPEWMAVEPLAGLAFLLGFMPALAIPISTAMESGGAFASNFAVAAIGAVIVLAGIVATSTYGTAIPALASLVVAASVQTATWLYIGIRRGILSASRLWNGTRVILLVQVLIGIALCLVQMHLDPDVTSKVLLFGTAGLLELTCIWSLRRHTRIGRILADYGILRSQPKKSGTC
jgi:O-antigen/teichoic acid export membrane protein